MGAGARGCDSATHGPACEGTHCVLGLKAWIVHHNGGGVMDAWMRHTDGNVMAGNLYHRRIESTESA